MGQIATTRLSSKGQVVIPEQIRKRLGLKAGVQFVVLGRQGVVILKAITPPTMDEFEGLLDEAKSAARKAGLRKPDIKKVVSRARKRK